MQVIREMNALVAAGYREVVISGINLGRWGRDLAVSSQRSAISEDLSREGKGRKLCFESLIRVILAETQIEKLRISSVEPMDWTDELIELVASSPRIAKHAHVPLQSGSDAVLRRMHRKYRPWHYREKIEKIRAAMPSAAIGADVMAGFPGETDPNSKPRAALSRNCHSPTCTYSPTPHAPTRRPPRLPNQVPVQVARERNKILRDVAAEKKLAFMRSFIGKPLDAITLNVTHCNSDGAFTEALTDNYQKLYLRGRHEPNRWIAARIEGVQDGVFVADLFPANSPTN